MTTIKIETQAQLNKALEDDSKKLLNDALHLLERSRDTLLLKPEAQIKSGEITAFIKRCKEVL